MNLQELGAWRQQFEQFHQRLSPYFASPEVVQTSAQYLRALMTDVSRKNGWQLAEALGLRRPDSVQRLLREASWEHDAVQEELLRFIGEVFGDPEGIVVFDETGFLKRGESSVGVARQYSGTAGKVENCQIGVFMTYRTKGAHLFLDRRLYLPETWCNDLERRRRAKVPDEIAFRTKPQLAVEMLRHTVEQQLPFRWATGDEVYGNYWPLREAIEKVGKRYVLAVSATTPVWLERPEIEEVSPKGGRGRPLMTPRVVPGQAKPLEVRKVVASWPESRWQRLSVREGEKGPIFYDWGRQRVVDKRGRLPGHEVWLLARRSITSPEELAYYLCEAPKSVALTKLAEVASGRFSIEQCFEEAKGETGLDEYEVRQWHCWYRHITLSLAAHTWLAWIRWQSEEKKGARRKSLASLRS